jgi:hypothetical protein
MNYIYTASKLATSTVERKLARITPLSMIACPFTVWTQDDTDMAFVTPTQTEPPARPWPARTPPRSTSCPTAPSPPSLKLRPAAPRVPVHCWPWGIFMPASLQG